MNAIGRQRWRSVAVLALALGAAAGCDNLLKVDLPTAVTAEDINTPSTASTQVGSILAAFECAYSSFAMTASGNEDNFQRYSGVAGTYSEYPATPNAGPCDGDAYSQEWVDPLLQARKVGYDAFNNITGYSTTDVPNKEQLLAVSALYLGAILDVFGEHYCEFAIDEGAPMPPSATLQLAADWVDTALAHVTASGGDFAIDDDSKTAGYDVLQGTITTSVTEMAHGLKSRIYWAMGTPTGLTNGASEAAMVSDNFVSYVLREDGEDRRNMVSTSQSGGGGTQAGGFLSGPVALPGTFAGINYGVTLLGNVPGTSTQWANPVPFTGYIDLAVDAEGRAVDGSGNAITTATMGAGGAADPRVPFASGNTAGGPDNIPQKYPNQSDDIPLVNWREMRLIQAEAAGPSAAGVTLVNSIRAADGVLPISGTYQTLLQTSTSTTEYRYMIFEERRRALFEEARFWSTKILNPTELWFPRLVGEWANSAASYILGGAVRLLMPRDEYLINPNFTINGKSALDARGEGCEVDGIPFQKPVFN